MSPHKPLPVSATKPGTKPGNGSVIAFQGLPGAYSDLACRQVFPGRRTRPCQTFEEAFEAVEQGLAALAMIPIENSVAGRVADIHQLIPHARLHIIGEHFQRVNHHLLAPAGASLATVRLVRSHVHALSQCRAFLHARGLTPVLHADTAGAAREIAERGDLTEAAIASELAAEIYGLQSLEANIEDAAHNTTRFVILGKDLIDPGLPDPGHSPDAGHSRAGGQGERGQEVMTAFHFSVRNIPAALYKALGGFATNGVNMTKLESYMEEGNFASSAFYAEIEGHPEQPAVARALEELRFFSGSIRIIGIFPAHPFRRAMT